MFNDVVNWLVVYIILLMGFSLLFLGASDYQSLVPGADTCSSGLGDRFEGSTQIRQSAAWSVPDSGVTSCHWTYIFVRPMVMPTKSLL
jgi:hypothetical protein